MIEMLDKFKLVSQKLEEWMIEAIYAHENLLQELISSQLLVGIKGSGSQVVPTYVPNYADFKRQLGSISVPYPDLHLTGATHAAIGIVRNEGLTFYFGVDNTPQEDLGAKLEDRYTSAIFELTDDNFEVFTNEVLNQVIDKIDGALK